MPVRLLLLALAVATGLTAATPLVWLGAIVADREATFDPAILGVWGETGGHDLLIFRRNGDRAGQARFLDVLPPAQPLRIPLHYLVRVWIDGDAVRYAGLDIDWVREKAAECLGPTAPAASIRDFLAKYGD